MYFTIFFLWCVITAGVIFLVKAVYTHFLVISCIKKLPGPPSKNVVVGNIGLLHGSEENLFKTVRQWGLEYYPIYKTEALLFFAAANILNPYDLETILSSVKNINKNIIYTLLEDWLGTGLLTSGNNKWHSRRKILTPSFHFNILQDFIEIFQEETDKLVNLFKKNCKHDVIDVTDYIGGFTLNTIGETAMGMNFDGESLDKEEYKKNIKEIALIYNYRLLRPWLLSKFLYYFDSNCAKEKKMVKILHKFTKTVIAKRQNKFKTEESYSYSKRRRLAMLDLLLTAKEEQGVIDDEGIREEVDTFMFEGHDTTAAAICFALMLIANHPEVQNKIVEEMCQVLGDGKKLNYVILQELKYMEMCIKEVLRLYPSVPFISRVLGEDMVTHNGYLLKAGSLVNIHIYDLHHNPEVYPDPEKFDPDRFLPEHCQTRHHFAYIPFSAGPRNCIGQRFALLEIKSVLFGILSEFVLEPVDTPTNITLLSQMVVRTKNGIRVKFVPRAKKVNT